MDEQDRDEHLAERLGALLRGRDERCVSAESCTGGGIAWTCTGVAGASDWFHGAFVTYSLEAKQQMLDVPAEMLERHGAVSEPVARAMAEGALDASGVELALAVTGVAGPGGGDILVPVGTVWFGWSLATARGRITETAVHRLDGDRPGVRADAVRVALAGAVDLLTGVART